MMPETGLRHRHPFYEQRRTAFLKVLIVDDDRQVALQIRDVLSEFSGYAVDIALNAPEAIEKVRAFRYDMMFADIFMPGMNGIALLKAVKQLEPSLPVVMITGFPNVDIAVLAMQEGASDYITKPFNVRRLQRIAESTAREHIVLLENTSSQNGVNHAKLIAGRTLCLDAAIRDMTAHNAVSGLCASLPIKNDVSTVYRHIVDVAREMTACCFSMLMIVDVQQRRLLPTAVAGLHGYRVAETVAAEHIPALNTMLERCKPVATRLPMPLHAHALGIMDADFLCMDGMVVPLCIQDAIFGMLIIGSRRTKHMFSGADIRRLHNVLRKACLTIENILLGDGILDTMRETLHALICAIEARDRYTLKHSLRVTDYAIRIAAMIGCSREETDILRSAGILHDIGKIGVSDTILLKTGILSAAETAIVHQHPVIGENILRPLGFLPRERHIIRYHHERFDGSGYPEGLHGNDIPVLSRIIAVADSYDAMTTDRPYRQAMQQGEALQELRTSAKQFDPLVIEAFFECMHV